MKLTNTYGATYMNHLGDDLMVVDAARVSFDKASGFDEGPPAHADNTHPRYQAWHQYALLHQASHLSFEDYRLIQYLANHGHWTPFAHPQVSFRVSAPLFVARQLGKHQVGLVWNEVSRRYVDSEPSFFMPDVWRKRADSVKQGSSDEEVTTYRTEDAYGPVAVAPSDESWEVFDFANRVYSEMLAAGICPEQARMVLPQSMMTEWVWTGSLQAFARVCVQRMDAHAQRECLPVANAINETMAALFPVSWEALMKGTRTATPTE